MAKGRNRQVKVLLTKKVIYKRHSALFLLLYGLKKPGNVSEMPSGCEENRMRVREGEAARELWRQQWQAVGHREGEGVEVVKPR